MLHRRSGVVVVLACTACSGGSAPPKAPTIEAPDKVEPARALVPPELPPVEPGALTWVDDEAELDAGAAFVLDGDRVLWAGEDGALRVAPIAGGAAKVLVRFGAIEDVAVAGGTAYVLGDDDLWSVAADGTVTGLADLYAPTHLAVTAQAIYVADGDWIRSVPLGGGEPTTLATDAGEPSSILATALDVYWTDGGYQRPDRYGRACGGATTEAEPHPNIPCSSETRTGALHRVPVGGGAVDTRPGQFPRGLTTEGAHVYWADDEGAMRASFQLDNAQRLLGAGAEGVAIDDASIVVLSDSGLVADLLRMHDDTVVRALDGYGDAVALDDAWIYLPSNSTLRRISRGPYRATLLATADGVLEDLALAGDDLYYVDADFDLPGGDYSTGQHEDLDDKPDTIRKVPRRGGAPSPVRVQDGDVSRIAVSGDHVFTLDVEDNVVRDSPTGAPFLAKGSPEEIVADAKHLYWIDGNTVMAMPIDGGKAEQLYPPPPPPGFGYLAGEGTYGVPPPAHLSIAGNYLVAASSGLGLDGVVRIDLRPPKKKRKHPRSEVLAPEFWYGAAAGDHVVAFTDAGLALFPGGKLLLADPAEEEDLEFGLVIADARDAFVIRGSDLVRVPLDGTKPDVLFTGVSPSDLALDADAVYVADGGVIVRITR